MPDIFVDKPTIHSEKQPLGSVLSTKKAREKTPHKLGILSTFVRDPMGIELAEQHDGEHILLFIRRDFITNVPWIASTVLLLIVPFFVPFLLLPIRTAIDAIPLMVMIILTLFYYLIVLGFAFGNFVTWFYDIGIVTEERAVDIDFYNISYVSVATARSQDLKDVRYFQRGFFQSFFDYGDVTLVVEASGETLTFEHTPRPAEVVSILSALIGGHQNK